MRRRVPPRFIPATAGLAVAVAASLAATLAAAPRLARAQALTPMPLQTPGLVEPPPAIVVTRPRFSVAVAMGATYDSAGLSGGAHAIPAFFATGGAGDGLLGVDFQVFSSNASGRFGSSQNPVDRLGFDGFGVVRPAGRFRLADRRYRMRVLRALGAELGLGLEREERHDGSGSRFCVHLGARADLPLTRVTDASEVRVRLAVRRDFGLFTPQVFSTTSGNETPIGDTVVELYGGLVFVF
jgi:hypothetical protein